MPAQMRGGLGHIQFQEACLMRLRSGVFSVKDSPAPMIDKGRPRDP